MASEQKELHEKIAAEFDTYSEIATDVEDLMTFIVERLQRHLLRYNWVGFYLIEKGRLGEEPALVLGPYIGASTPHRRIPLNRGICGAAASSGQTIVVDDVRADPRYLSCSIETKSEIVVPVRANGKVVGELDIDSHTSAAFDESDRNLCEHVAALVGRFIERNA